MSNFSGGDAVFLLNFRGVAVFRAPAISILFTCPTQPNPMPPPSFYLSGEWSDVCSLVGFLVCDGSWPDDAHAHAHILL